MFNDEGLGAAMAQHYAEKKTDDLAVRVALIEARQLVLYKALCAILSPDEHRYLAHKWDNPR